MGYGNKGGTCYVYDGYIEMESDGSLDKSEYMTILVKYPPETFTMENKLVKNKLPYTFDYYYNMAEDGADHYIQKNKSNSVSALTGIIVSAVPFLLVFFALFALIAKAGNSQLNFGKTGNKVPKDAPMFRDIPCKGDIFRGYFIAKNYNLMKKKTDFLGAVLLKWLKEGKIKIEKREVGKVFNKEDTCIIFDNTTTFDNVYEKDLHNMFFKASKDGILEKKEFEKWCSNNYSEILGWFDDLLKFEQSGLLNEGKIIKEENKKLGFKNYRYTVDSSLMEEAKELYGLKKFLDDFTLIDKREAIEVALFEDYLIFAQILGISKKVASQFKKLYPEVIEQYNYDYNDILLIHSISDAGVSKANSAKSRAESYSSGRRRILIWRWPEVAHLVAGGGGGGFR